MEINSKLLIEQLNLLEKSKETKLIEKLDSFLDKSLIPEKLSFKVIVGEKLADLSIPYPVKGYFLSEGRPKRRFYPAEELEKAVKNPKNKTFRLILDHFGDKASAVVGKVSDIYYDKETKKIGWSGHINDLLTARNVDDKVLTEVSATIYGEEYYDEINGLSCKNLEFDELSIVIKGSDPSNSINGTIII